MKSKRTLSTNKLTWLLLAIWLMYSMVALYWFHRQNPVFGAICRAFTNE
ncbi:hypothetical protein LIN78_05225 [Leeia sp. TBRC 13508]|uniref:ATP synthase F0 subunit 8 n=1 Tax=Leeia speluncae TaxID=2884804 RepID=A0ABS8D432_9NEIS|nr:hypothetical protein [Leeia speluncae]MCB6182948.1 hypothetical protein [Leeia speluncae]